MGRRIYYVVEYVPDITKDEKVAVGVIVDESGHRNAQFRGDWRKVQSAHPQIDIEYFQALGKDISMSVQGPEWPDTLRRLRETLGNNVQITGPLESSDEFAAIVRRYLG